MKTLQTKGGATKERPVTAGRKTHRTETQGVRVTVCRRFNYKVLGHALVRSRASAARSLPVRELHTQHSSSLGTQPIPLWAASRSYKRLSYVVKIKDKNMCRQRFPALQLEHDRVRLLL